jgi:hypothetical protein
MSRVCMPSVSTIRPEVRDELPERLEDVLVEKLGYGEARIDRLGFGAKVDLALDDIEDMVDE